MPETVLPWIHFSGVADAVGHGEWVHEAFSQVAHMLGQQRQIYLDDVACSGVEQFVRQLDSSAFYVSTGALPKAALAVLREAMIRVCCNRCTCLDVSTCRSAPDPFICCVLNAYLSELSTFSWWSQQ